MEMNSMGWFQRIVRAVSIVQIRQDTRWGPFHKIHISVDKGHWNFTNPQECSFFRQSLRKIHWWTFIPSENFPYQSNSFVKDKFCFSAGTLRKSGPQSNNLQKFLLFCDSPQEIWSSVLQPSETDQFWYIKIHTWQRCLAEWNKRNHLEAQQWIIYFYCFIPPSLGTKYEF